MEKPRTRIKMKDKTKQTVQLGNILFHVAFRYVAKFTASCLLQTTCHWLGQSRRLGSCYLISVDHVRPRNFQRIEQFLFCHSFLWFARS